MHEDLKEVIATAKAARAKLLDKEIAVKEANGIYNQNHSILTAYAIDLRNRIFLAESAEAIASHETRLVAATEADNAVRSQH